MNVLKRDKLHWPLAVVIGINWHFNLAASLQSVSDLLNKAGTRINTHHVFLKLKHVVP
jgi:hypothetical protein